MYVCLFFFSYFDTHFSIQLVSCVILYILFYALKKIILVKSTGFTRLLEEFMAQKAGGPLPGEAVLIDVVKPESLCGCGPALGNTEKEEEDDKQFPS